MSIQVIELVRVSTEGQAAADRASIPAQRAVNRLTAARFGLEIVHTIEMADVSGSAVLHSPEMRELLRRMESADIEGVVTREFSRLMRPEDYGDFAILQAFVETKTILYLPEGPIDFSSKTGRLMGTVRAAIAGLELSEIKERTMAAKEQMRRAGQHPGGDTTLPYGVGYEKTRGWFYKSEIVKVQEAFRQFLAGNTCYASLAQLLGVSRSGVRTILQNTIYTGWRTITEKRDLSAAAKRLRKNGRQGDRRKVKRSPEDVIRVRVMEEAAVGEAEFKRVQLAIQQKAENGLRQRTKVGQFTYNGFLYCSKCGARIHTQRNQFDRYYYVCSNKKRKDNRGERRCPYTGLMNRNKLEPMLDELLKAKLTQPAFLRHVYEGQKESAQQPDVEAARLRLDEHEKELLQKRQRIIEAYLDGVLDRRDRDVRLEALNRDLRSTRELICQQALPPSAFGAQALAELLAPFLEWDLLAREQKRALLFATVPDIRVADYGVTGLFIRAAQSCDNASRPRVAGA